MMQKGEIVVVGLNGSGVGLVAGILSSVPAAFQRGVRKIPLLVKASDVPEKCMHAIRMRGGKQDLCVIDLQSVDIERNATVVWVIRDPTCTEQSQRDEGTNEDGPFNGRPAYQTYVLEENLRAWGGRVVLADYESLTHEATAPYAIVQLLHLLDIETGDLGKEPVIQGYTPFDANARAISKIAEKAAQDARSTP